MPCSNDILSQLFSHSTLRKALLGSKRPRVDSTQLTVTYDGSQDIGHCAATLGPIAPCDGLSIVSGLTTYREAL